MRISVTDIDLMLDALARAASRHESMARSVRAGGFSMGQHDRKAARMRELRVELMRMKAAHAPPTVEVA